LYAGYACRRLMAAAAVYLFKNGGISSYGKKRKHDFAQMWTMCTDGGMSLSHKQNRKSVNLLLIRS
jgi:hypothetical protein